MQAEIIAIGDEILIGQTIDTNSSFIATHLNLNGISVKQKRVIADEPAAITDALDSLFPETRLVFMTGGLGPTKDDITKKTLADYFDGELVFHEEVFEHIKELFATFGREPSQANRDQAYLPSSCELVENEIGTAAGMHFQKEGRHYFSLPGVPYETQRLVEKKIIPWIKANLQKGTVVHHTLLTQGVPESMLAERLSQWEDELPADIKLAYLPSPGLVRLRLSCYSGSEEEARGRVMEQAERARDILGRIIFGTNDESLEGVVGKILQERGQNLATAESCTGGNIAGLITAVPGSSAYFQGGVVAYSSALKQSVLGVLEETLLRHGAVSEAVVKEMAAGACREFGTDWAIATSGVAGPGGGSDDTPVGTVWIAVAGPVTVKAKCFNFGRSRSRNIQRASLMALDMLRRELQKFES